jgi:3-dehydroquinate dehydratase/shikimate dehydrogenase
MSDSQRRFCASLNVATAREAAARAGALPAEVRLVELRADLLDPAELATGAWTELPQSAGGRQWIFTWRSPEEGGRRRRQIGVLARALAAGFAAVDVEARDLENGDPETLGIPAERRWISRHRLDPLSGPGDLVAEWAGLRRHAGALHKLVVPAHDFRVNDWVLALVPNVGGGEDSPRTIFAAGGIGHVSRILGYLLGNSVTYLAVGRGEETAAGQPTLREALDVYQLPHLPPDPRLYGVLGGKAGASRSPELHNHAFRMCGERSLYLPLPSPDPAPVLAWLATGRLRGLSVTMPHKEAALSSVDDLEADARRVGAVNTLWSEGGRVHGANTDLEAARAILTDLGLTSGDPIAVLGGGGAAAAVLAAAGILDLECTVYNRSAPRAEALCARMGARYGGPLDGLTPGSYRGVVNATPMGAAVPLPECLESADWSGVAILDLAYGEERTDLERIAAAAGSRCVGGLNFLARQAAGQFRRWTHRHLDPEHFAAGLRR